MPYDRFRHHRHTLRLRGYDYTRAAAYFVTIRTVESGDVLGAVVEGSVVLNDIGRLVEECWQALPDHFDGVRLDDFVIMPDHLHGIIILPHGVPVRRVSSPNPQDFIGPRSDEPRSHESGSNESRSYVGARHASPRPSSTPPPSFSPPPGSLGCVIGSFKSASSKMANRVLSSAGASFWQRNYHDRIVRDKDELEAFRRYIAENPLRWGRDRDPVDPVHE